MNWRVGRWFAAALWSMTAAAAAGQNAPAEIVSLRQLKELTPAQAAIGPSVKIKGIVVCYDAGWHQLYLDDGRECLYFNADEFAAQPRAGESVEITGKARGTNVLEGARLTVLGDTALPQAEPMALSDLARRHGEWVQITGRLLTAENSRGRLALVLNDNGWNCLVYLLGGPCTNNFREWLGRRLQMSGINASRSPGDRLEAGLVFAPVSEEIKALPSAGALPSQSPVTSIGNLLNRELGSWTNDWVHLNGLVVSYQPGQWLVVKDPTGVMRARIIQLTDMRGDERVDVWGFLQAAGGESFLDRAFFQVTQPPAAGDASSDDAATPPGPDRPQPALARVADVLKLAPQEAAQHWKVHLRGVITFSDSQWRHAFLQEGNDAIYLDLDPIQTTVRSGDLVDLTGQTRPGFAPEVWCESIHVLGVTNLPPAANVDLEDLANGQFDSHWVRMEGLVRRVDELAGHASLSLMTPKGRFRAIIPGFEDRPLPAGLEDTVVSVEGACTSELNVHRQLSGITLHVPGLDHIRVVEAAPADPFAVPATRIDTVATFNPNGAVVHRVKIQGVVTLLLTGQGFILQDDTGGMRALSRQTNAVHLGDKVEALGFPAIGDYSPYLEEAVFRTLGPGVMPAPQAATAEQILLRGNNDAQIVQLQARLLQNVPHSANPQLVLQEGPIIFTASLENRAGTREVPDLKSGSQLRLTGVCAIQGGEGHEPAAFRLLLRDPSDVVLLEAPSIWTARRAFYLAGGMMLIGAAALGWVALLRRQVRSQTNLIRQKLEDEAALEARYRELFEHATDMLYTHDAAGRITSINQTGERLLQRPRKEILRRSLLDFVVEEQRMSARQWLDSILRGASMPATELDFTAASGEIIKLEISARLIEDARDLEIEGIARDITERKRLEREILEISNREQRRIGHDLHDGVCQQLAGIAFLTSTLAEDLEGDGVALSHQAEKISGMINQVIDQTRGVARGLFPVRLDEKGLPAALEELAANASDLYRIDCRFRLEGPPVEIENEIALHLHYIVLEALANAAKHSGATAVSIDLCPAGDRWLLTVSDNGCGFAVPVHNHDGMGLRILNYRARVIGATLSLRSDPGSGTTVSCLFLPASRDFSRGAPRRPREEAAAGRKASS